MLATKGLVLMGIWLNVQTPILWSHGISDGTVLFEAGQAGPPFLQQIGVTCEFKVQFFTLHHDNVLVFFF